MKKEKILGVVLLTYFLCYSFRIFEYFVLRTDKAWIGEAIVHKLIGIAILFVVTGLMKFTVTEIEFFIFYNLYSNIVLLVLSSALVGKDNYLTRGILHDIILFTIKCIKTGGYNAFNNERATRFGRA